MCVTSSTRGDWFRASEGGEKWRREQVRINPHAKGIFPTGYSLDPRELERLGGMARAFVNKRYEVKRPVQAVKPVMEAEGPDK
jgi:hypothetical protein